MHFDPWSSVWVFVSTLLFCVAAPSQEQPKEAAPVEEIPVSLYEDRDSPADKALRKTVNMEFLDANLKQLAEDVQKRFNLNVWIDTASFQKENKQVDEIQISGTTGDVTLREALDLFLNGTDIVYQAKQQSLVFYHQGSVANETRIYPAIDLLMQLSGVPSEDIPKHDGDPLRPEVPMLAGSGCMAPDRAEDLASVLKNSVASDDWEENGGSASLRYVDGFYVFVVEAPQSLHRRLESAFTSLRRSRGVTEAICRKAGLPDLRDIVTARYRYDMKQKERWKQPAPEIRPREKEQQATQTVPSNAERETRILQLQEERAQIELERAKIELERAKAESKQKYSKP